MRKIFLLFIFILCILNFAFPQNSLVKKWDYRYGGTDGDNLFSIIQTSDSGYILAGSSSSGISGDKTHISWGSSDYWIVKLDSLGIKQWDKDLGGADGDMLGDVQQTSDGGYILGGHSSSGISGDKTQNTKGGADYWIVKIDSLGNKLWDRDYGGLGDDVFSSIDQTFDGGYILAGWTTSGIGGDKTQDTWGNSLDYWIVKIDSFGNKLWDKDFGGTGKEALSSIRQTSDSGFIIGGFSTSGISGDKTQINQGLDDYWIVKTDSLGNKQWDKDFGGTESDELKSILETTDGGFTLGGTSLSGISGDKTENTWGGADYWIVKINSLGNKQWDKDIGGIGPDQFLTIQSTIDSGYLLAGDSYSPIGGNKTEANLGMSQTWAVKTDSLGNVVWDKTVFTLAQDQHGMAISTNDGCYVMTNWGDGPVGGYKSQPSWGFWDYWVIKFCITLQAGFTSSTYVCPGSCIDFTNLSFNATSYQWFFPGASPDTSTATNPTNICYAIPGSYDVTLIASDANGKDTLFIGNYVTVYPQPQSQSIIQNGDTLFANAGASAYQWYFNGNIINGATEYYYVAIQSGDYNLIATDSNGCEVEAVINNVLAHTPLAVGYWPMAVYPNPVTSTIDIRGLENNSADEIKIFNVFGEKVFSAVDWKLGTLNCELFPSGLYILELKTNNKEYRLKFMKQ